MADFKWYEQRAFAWSDDECNQEPMSAQLDAMLAVLATDGWEDDPVFANVSGTVHVRRPYSPGIQREVLGQMAVGVAEHGVKLKSIGEAVEGLVDDVEWMVKWRQDHGRWQATVDGTKTPEDPVDEPSPCLGDLLDAEYPDASWKLTIKVGTW